MLWWSRVTCCPISKYWLSGYRQWKKHIFYCTNIGRIIDWPDVCWIVWNELIQVSVIRRDMNRVGIFVIPNYRFFAPNFFNFKIIFAFSIFDNVVASQVFHCHFPLWHAMYIPCRWDLKSWLTIKRCCSCLLCYTMGLWSQGVCVGSSQCNINIPPVSGNISTTTQNPEGEVIPITVSHYFCLVEVEGGCLNSRIHPIFCVSPEQVHDTHQVFYRPFYFSSWQWYLSRFSVLVIQFLVIIFPSGVDISFFSFYYIAKAS